MVRNKKLDLLLDIFSYEYNWNLKKVKSAALKYKIKSHFMRDLLGAYSWAKRNNVLNEMTLHMKNVIRWNLEDVKQEALKYDNLKSFIIGSKSAYNWMIKNNHKEEITKHFKK